MFQENQLIGEKYRIKKLLGRGGFGSVYLAEETWLKKLVAIKVPKDQDPSLPAMLGEPRMLGQLDHPNIVRVTTCEKEDNIFFFVMEYVDGESLESILGREGALPLETFFQYMEQILSAVEYAHKKNVLHRDLRPANILISKDGVLKVADFGISKVLKGSACAHTRVGSPPYMAPEQFLGHTVLASDIYSLGVMMYEMLTGSLPIYDTDISIIQKKAAEGHVTPPNLKKRSIPERLGRITMKAMAPKIEQRYQSAADLRRELLLKGGVREQSLEIENIRERLRARESTSSALCWNCRKPLPKKAATCRHCGETQ
jgi:serine/threonine protein kinase